MASISIPQHELVLHTLQQIRKAIIDLKTWNRDFPDMEELAKSPDGMQRLAGNCMLIQAIGEGIKQIDKRTDGKLLALLPNVPWRQIKGMRDRISHGYFELDTEYIDDILKNDLDPLLDAMTFLIDKMKGDDGSWDVL